MRDHRAEDERARWERRHRSRAGTTTNFQHDMSAAARRDGEALLREVPPDTRGLTERLCGDPVVGRRAIDRMEPGESA